MQDTDHRGAAPPQRVLILDDDELVGVLLETVARLDGLATRLTSGHEDFFAALDTWAPTHLVIDLTMPGMTGEDVLRELALRQCRAAIIIASGSEPQRLEAAVAQARSAALAVVGTLPKPFTPAQVRAALSAATSTPV
jgi:CheY-like chemotaxis protein